MHEIAQHMTALVLSSAEKPTIKHLFLNCPFQTALLVRKKSVFTSKMNSV